MMQMRLSVTLLMGLACGNVALGQNVESDVAYVVNGHLRHKLDIYTPEVASSAPLQFGNDPGKHVDFSAVTHVEKGKGIPPFLILYFSGNPDTRAQAGRLEEVLQSADIPAKAFGVRDSNHSRLNNDLGKPDDPATKELYEFLDQHVGSD